MALILLPRSPETLIVDKPDRRKTPRYTDRLKALHERVDRLLIEARLIRAQMDDLHGRDEVRELRRLLRRQHGRAPFRLVTGTDDR